MGFKTFTEWENTDFQELLKLYPKGRRLISQLAVMK
jgi:hypothetical protein